MIVVDASVLAPALGDDGPDGNRARMRLRGERLVAPELVDLEVTSVLRRLHQRGRPPAPRIESALADLTALPLRRVSHRPLLSRCWALRESLTVYDAAYVALAEELESPFPGAPARRVCCHVRLGAPPSTLVPFHPVDCRLTCSAAGPSARLPGPPPVRSAARLQAQVRTRLRAARAGRAGRAETSAPAWR